LSKHVISVNAKATAEEFGFKYLNEDLNAGLHNLADLTATYLAFQEIPDNTVNSPSKKAVKKHLIKKRY
jgi:hypothetical protein